MVKKNRYLTKSRFVLALECPTKLFYLNKQEFPNQKDADSFMYELAKGGLQIGELAKFYFVDDPIGDSITLQARAGEHEKSLQETQVRLDKPGKVIIAEAAFLYRNCFIRADIIEKDRSGNLKLYEVKSKSYREGEDILERDGKISSEWRPYLYDIAFQKWVVERSTGRKVSAFLSVINKDIQCTVAGLAKFFTVTKDQNNRPQVKVAEGLTREDLGIPLLKNINVDEICELIYSMPLKLNLDKEYSFEEGIRLLSDSYEHDVKLKALPTSNCKSCEFYPIESIQNSNQKSGIKECWVGNGWVSENSFDTEDLVLELWGGKAGPQPPVSKLISLKKYLLKDVKRSDFETTLKVSSDGLSPNDRRELQINKAKAGNQTPFVEKNGLQRTFDSFQFPLHFIDFETTATALPWFQGMRPYQGVAFQFSHHTVDERGTVKHAHQYISFEPGVYPNFQFVRELRQSLGERGTILRYHNHENTYLNFIYSQLNETPDVPDNRELQDFIRTITEWKEQEGNKKISKKGPRNMVDLHEIVLKYYYSFHAKGSNSLKDILPSAIKDFEFLRSKYSKPIYGKQCEIESLNFDEKIWIREDVQNDPYKTLVPVFDDYPREALDRLAEDADIITDGGSAMMAFNMLQLSSIPEDQRLRIKKSLLEYCELDTMAMVMLYEGLRSAL